VINRGKANEVLRKAQECGAAGGTIFLGEGTVQSSLLEKIGLTKTDKEIVVIPTSNDLCNTLHETIEKAFMLSKRDRGIAFSIPFKRRKAETPRHDPREEVSTKCAKCDSWEFCIMTIVDKGRSKECIRAARAAGARGATLIRGRGAGVPTDYYFPLVVEAQKDIVMIITTEDKVDAISERIFTDLELEKPGNGILFVLPVTRTSGVTHSEEHSQEAVTS
jgi:nitrogen regulatory protein PII